MAGKCATSESKTGRKAQGDQTGPYHPKATLDRDGSSAYSPGSPSGCIEALISQSVQSLASSGVREVTFGAGATEEIELGSTFDGTVRSKTTRKTYKIVVAQVKLVAKSEFQEKAGASADRVFICCS